MNRTLYFTAIDGSSRDLWKSDGTKAGTVMVKEINPTGNAIPNDLSNVDGTLHFSAYNGSKGTELWKSDGAEGGTQMVKDINPGEGSSWPQYLSNVDGTLYFSAADVSVGADDGCNGGCSRELWKSDGTKAGTVRVKNINLSASSVPSQFTNVNGTLHFRASGQPNGGDITGYELWTSDGTEAGTVLVKDIVPGLASSYPEYLANVTGSTRKTAA